MEIEVSEKAHLNQSTHVHWIHIPKWSTNCYSYFTKLIKKGYTKIAILKCNPASTLTSLKAINLFSSFIILFYNKPIK